MSDGELVEALEAAKADSMALNIAIADPLRCLPKGSVSDCGRYRETTLEQLVWRCLMGGMGATKGTDEGFRVWLEILYKRMQPDLGDTPANLYCAPDDWRDYYDDGDTPEEAWASEKSYWSE